LPDLIIFLEIVRAGSLTTAAQRLNTVQSNLTARVKQLEKATGTALLQRHARGIKPTPAGEALMALALRTETILTDLYITFDQGARAPVGASRLRLGSIETAAASHLPARVACFAHEFPRTDVSVETGSSAALLQKLKSGELDVAFVSHAPGFTGYRETVAFEDQLVMVVPAAITSVTTLLKSGSSPIKVLVQRLGCSYTERLLTFLTQKSTRGHQVRQLGTLEGVLGFVEVGAGVAAMPLAFAHAAAGKRRVRFIELPPKFARLQTFQVAPAARDSSFAVNAFVSHSWKQIPVAGLRPFVNETHIYSSSSSTR
jgi:DNA-binding transcriptional LysR family regulator